MKTALTVWDGRISPVFDVSREAVVLTLEDGVERARSTERIEAPTAALKIARLQELGIELLVCGAISESLQQELSARGIRVLGFVAGALEEVLSALLAGGLPGPELAMPGCRGPQRRVRAGQGAGRGRGRGQGKGQSQGQGQGRGRRGR